MATALAAQLQALATSTEDSNRNFAKPNTRPSIIFDARQAADIDIATIFSLSLSGLEELATINPIFANFKKTLFSVESCQTDRELQGQEFNSNLNASIHSFMCLVSDFLLLSPAHQTLEYLIRRYKIHIYNVDDLIRFTLPYHGTSLFVRVMQLSNIEKTRWHFLEGVRKSGAAPPREVLVQKCLHDMTVLEGICESGHAFKIGSKVLRAKTAYSFSVAIVIEVLDAAQEVHSMLVNKVLSYATHSFDKKSSEEFEVGGLMIIGTLANKARLSKDALAILFDLISRVLAKELSPVEGGVLCEMAVMVLIQIVQMQSVKSFPDKAFQLMVKVRDLPKILSKINASFNIGAALTLIINGLIRHCQSNLHYRQMLQELLDAVPLRSLAESITLNILDLVVERHESPDVMDERLGASELVKVIQAIKDRFPEEVDQASHKFLEAHTGAKDTILSLLNRSFKGSLYAILPESNQSIHRSLQHPQAHVRKLAIQQVAAIAKSDLKMKSVCSEVLLLGLGDTDLSVVESVLSVDGLATLIDCEELFISLSSIIERCVTLLENGPRSLRGEAISAGKHCLNFMSSVYLDVHPSYVERVGHVFLSNMLLSKKSFKLNLKAIKLAKNMEWSFFKGLSVLKDESLKISEEKEKKVWLHELNTKIIKLLATSLLENIKSLSSQITECAIKLEHAKPLVVLVLLQSLTKNCEGLNWDSVNEYIGFLKQEWIALETTEEFPTYKFNDDNILQEEVFTLQLFKTLLRDPKLALASLLLACFYKVLKCVPEISRGRKKDYEHTICNTLEELFVFFSSPRSKMLFEEHLKLLLRKVPIPPVIFFSPSFNAEGGTVPKYVQLNSLNLLLSHCNDATNIPKLDIQLAVPHLVTALASPIKAVRRASFECLRKLFERWTENTAVLFVLPNGSQMHKKVLDTESFEMFMESLMEYRDSFVSDGEFLCTFFTFLLGFCNGQKQIEAYRDSTLSNKLRFKKPIQMAIYQFLLHNALTMPLYAQSILVIALKGAVALKDQAIETKKVLSTLLRRWREWKVNKSDEGSLTKYEVQLFRHLLQIHLHYEGMFSVPKGRASQLTQRKLNDSSAWFQSLMEVLNVEKEVTCLDLDLIETLCIALSCLEERMFKSIDINLQDAIFKRLVELSMVQPEPLQLASHTALQNLQVNSSTVLRYINGLLEGDCDLLDGSMTGARKSLTAVLEFLLRRNDMSDMHDLIPSLFGSLRKLTRVVAFGDKANTEGASTKHVEGFHLSYVQQLVLEVLEKIVNSTHAGVEEETMKEACEVDFLVEFIHVTTDVTTLNQSLSLLATLARASPGLVLEHVISVFSVMGETTLIQEDSHSYVIIEKLIAAIVPNWLEKMKDPKLLLQIFVKALPDVPKHRGLPFVKTTLRLMQESTSLHILLLLLLESSLSSKVADIKSVKRKSVPESDKARWLEDFSATVCEEYELSIRLPALLNLLNASQQMDLVDSWRLKDKIVVFISNQLQKNGLLTEMQTKKNEPLLRATIIKMLEEVLSLLQRTSIEPIEKKTSFLNRMNSFRKNASHLLESITQLLSPGLFAEAIIQLLKSRNENLRIKALQLVAAKMKSSGLKNDNLKRNRKSTMESKEEEISKDTLNAYEHLVETIGALFDDPDGGDVIAPAILALHSCSQQLAKHIPSAFVANLRGLIKHSKETSIYAPASLQCIATIVVETGFSVLPMLGELITRVIRTSKQHSFLSQSTHAVNGIPRTDLAKEVDLQMAILGVLEAVVQNLGGFLSPYLSQILELLLLEPCLLASTNKKLVEKADFVRHLLPRTVPVRLLLEPLISTYEPSLQKGEASLLACINMLSLVVTSFDKSSVVAHYKTVFELCLHCFDLRRMHPSSLKCVTVVETSVLSLFSALVMKLSESTFKPLFVRILEWAEVELPADDEGKENQKSVLRNIVFYRVVNQLADKLRSVFVPYFQYLLKGCVKQLMDGQVKETVRPRKKLKVSSKLMEKKSKQAEPTSSEWHLRYLVVSALQKCFVYDSMGFLDTQRFQMLLGPLVQQITVPGFDADTSSALEWIPSVQDMDSALVACLGQMAITAGTDLLWKPLNHEVLLCTRSEVLRARLLSLDIIKFLVDNLKEDYLALLPETIPFLAELLEDHEMTVVSKSQEIIKLLEELSGESLSQYL